MNAILGYVQLLERDPALTAQQRRFVRTIARSGDHLLEMINDVLEMSKIEAGVRQVHAGPFDLHAVFDDLARMFQLRADDKRIGFAVRVGPGVPRWVVADDGKLRQIAVNLLSNAVRLTHRGRVEVRVSLERASLDAVQIAVEIDDTGPGISPEDLARLFQPFAQTRTGARARGGTGLGLALSRELVRLMGGDITVSSRVGAGSVFRFSLPLAVHAPTPGGGAEVDIAPSSTRVAHLAGSVRPRVLVVDDSEEGRNWVSVLLRQVGFDVIEAGDGRAALEAHGAWTPHLVLMDLHMPVMDGFAAIRCLRERPGPRPVIIALSAGVLDDTRADALSAGADAWLGKPCREGELLETIARHLDLHYVYEPAARSARASAAAAAEALPPDLAAPLRQAARLADYDNLCALIDALPSEHAAAAASLTKLASEFAYDRIEALVSGEAAVSGSPS
jgi:two-component system sensor histidine kinase/response regulator